jgi:hypothetical protein
MFNMTFEEEKIPKFLVQIQKGITEKRILEEEKKTE